MAVGDTYYYSDGRPYIQTDAGPLIMWECDDCGRPAAAALDYVGVIRCSACWPAATKKECQPSHARSATRQ